MRTLHLNKTAVAMLSCMAVWAAPGYAYDLKEAAQEAALNNPEVVSKWHAYRESTEGIEVVRGGYFPKVDLSAGSKREHLNEAGPFGRNATYSTRGASLYLQQLLFDGFYTQSEVERLSYAQRVRYFELLDATEATALEVVRAYNDVLRYRKLYLLAEDNYVQHRAIYEQIGRRVKAGVGRLVDLEQASGRLALSESNLLTETSNLHDVSARFQRIVGKVPPAEMREPALMNKDIPKTKNEAVSTGYLKNPTILAAQENIVSAMAEARGTNAAFMPKVYFEARRDLGYKVDGIDNPPESSLTSYGVVLNYNLFNGGSDSARKRQVAERVNVAKDLRDKACRDIRQSVTIAFNDIKKIAENLEYLDQHQLATEKARDAYRKQFDIGQRTLLDLLDTENELFEARIAYVKALHDQAFAHARTQAGMGNLLQQMGLQNLEVEGLAKQEEIAEFDPLVLCPPDGEMVVTLDKDKIFRDAIKARPELLPDRVPAATPAVQPAAAAKPAVKPPAAPKKP
jgi:outer membrane protein, adhesin transport system